MSGWWGHNTQLLVLLPHTAPMKFNAAAAFFITGIALLFLSPTHKGSARGRWVVLACSLTVLAISLLTLFEHITGINLGIDELFVTETAGPFVGSTPGRPALATVVSFTLIAFSLIIQTTSKKHSAAAAQLLAATAAVLPFITVIGYIFGVRHLYGLLATVTPIAFQASVGLCLVSIGILAVAPEQGFMQVFTRDSQTGLVMRKVFPLSLVILLVFGWLQRQGNLAGAYQADIGLVIMITLAVICLSILFYWCNVQLYKAEKSLLDSEKKTRLIIEAAADAFIEINVDGVITDWNKESERLFGWSRQEAIGKTLVETIVPVQLRNQHLQGIQHFIATDEGPVLNQRIEMPALHRDGWQFPIELVVFPIKRGHLLSFCAFIHDTRNRKLLEERNKRLSLMEQREDFVETLSHDLRNPLIGLEHILDMLTAGSLGELSELQQSVLKEARLSNKDLLNMVQKVIGVFRYERTADSITLQQGDLVTVITERLAAVNDQVESKALQLHRILPEAAVIFFDYNSISMLIDNLLENAIKFSRAGGKITVELQRDSAGLMLSVADNGTGIHPKDREWLFYKFWQSGGGSRYTPGTGLGLYLCRVIVAAHGGTIACESEPGQGTKITVNLPGNSA